MAIGILAAYIHADKTGEGQFVDQSMADAVINLMRVRSAVAGSFAVGGKPAQRQPEPDVIKCKGDGPNDYVFVVISTDKHFETMMKILGRDDLLNSPLKNDRNLRMARMSEIRSAIAAWTATKDKIEVFHTLAKEGIPAAPVLDTIEVLNDPHFNQRGIITEFNHKKRGKFKMPGCPIRLSKNDYEYRAAPLLGEHNEEVYQEWMGFDKEEVARLKAEKIL
jgi:formyl-CoA transferase